MLAPKSLLELQEWMSETFKRPPPKHVRPKVIEEAAIHIRPSQTLPPHKRLGIYHTQIWLRFYKILQKEYPSLARLFGSADFNKTIAKPYLQKYFPTHSSLSRLGETLPKHLASTYRAEDKRLILPLAEIDAAYHRLKNSAPSPSFLGNRVQLQPTVALFTLNANLFAFRSKLLKESVDAYEELDFPPLKWDLPVHYLLSYQKEQFQIDTLPPIAFKILSAMQTAIPLENVLASLSETESLNAKPHIFSWFQEWASRGWL